LSATYRLLRFGVFELNLDLEEIRKNGTPLKLPPQPFQLLSLLASRSGQVVTREEIQKQLWGHDTFIDFEQGVNKCIKQIRTALSDNAENPLYLETIPRRGYRFLAPVRTKTVPAPPPQVREATSAFLPNIAEQVRARVEAASQTSPAAPPQATGESVAPPPAQPPSIPAPVPAPAPAASLSSKRARLIGSVIGLGAIIAVVLYWLLSHAMR
jgi:DNA-binding winged helix-turn-helix (wHTH) protein